MKKERPDFTCISCNHTKPWFHEYRNHLCLTCKQAEPAPQEHSGSPWLYILIVVSFAIVLAVSIMSFMGQGNTATWRPGF